MTEAYYAATAYDSSRARSFGRPENSKFSFTTRQLRKNPLAKFTAAQCGEFLSMDHIQIIELLNSEDEESRKDIASPGHEWQPWQTLRNPKVAIETIVGVMAFASFCFSIAFLFILGIMLYYGRWNWFLSSNFLFTICFTASPGLIYFAGKVILRKAEGLDRQSIILNRRKGTIFCPSKKNPDLEIPFEEFDPYINRSTDTSARIGYHLCLCHRYSEEWITCPDEQDDLWGVYQLWEFWQQYMDISKPLPDVPRMEPYRSRDPVTAAYDKQRGRPADYWKKMDIEKADAMQDAAMAAAARYPWGLTREQALAAGWQPSGVGEGDWRDDHRDADQPLQANATN